VHGYLYALPFPNDSGWQLLYIVRYEGTLAWCRQEYPFYISLEKATNSIDSERLHVVQWFGSSFQRTGVMPKDPPLLFPAYLACNSHDADGNPKILFKGNHEKCEPYWGFVEDQELETACRLFCDGSEPLHKQYIKLTRQSWERVRELSIMHKKPLSFRCESEI